MMIGSLESSVAEAQRIPENLPPVINDLDIEEEDVAIENRAEYLNKVGRRILPGVHLYGYCIIILLYYTFFVCVFLHTLFLQVLCNYFVCLRCVILYMFFFFYINLFFLS